MQYNDLVRDFAKRTRSNLEAIKKLQKENQQEYELYEVTQLINSCLGLLVFPQQGFYDKIERIPLNELTNDGWPNPEVLHGEKSVQDLNKFINYMRNAIAHFNIKFLAGERNQIVGIELWNIKKGNKRKIKDWHIRLRITELEKLLDKFVGLVMEK